MLREPRKVQKRKRKRVQVRKDKRTGRFRIEKLEGRIAPAGHGCFYGQKCDAGGGPQ